jgi:CHASE2 domain-containing sensor protein
VSGREVIAALGAVFLAFYLVCALAFLEALCKNAVPFLRALGLSAVWPYTFWRVTR